MGSWVAPDCQSSLVTCCSGAGDVGAVDVGRFTDHPTAVIDARLHDADVVAHDEHDVGFLLLLRGCRQHKQGVAGTYNRAKYADDMRDALQRWADHLDKICAQ
jgi:hypothetical protein